MMTKKKSLFEKEMKRSSFRKHFSKENQEFRLELQLLKGMRSKSLKKTLGKDLSLFSFALFLRAARTGKDLSQTEMARFLGITSSTLCNLEKGRQLVSPALASKIAKRCKLSEIVAVEAALKDQLRCCKLNMDVSVKSLRNV